MLNKGDAYLNLPASTDGLNFILDGISRKYYFLKWPGG